jgi:membrane protease YdiL (CAAX protease family)
MGNIFQNPISTFNLSFALLLREKMRQLNGQKEKRRCFPVLMFLVWLIFLLIGWAHFATGDENLKSFLQHLTYFYFLAVSLGIVRFVEKQSVIERFGLQSLRYLGLVTLVGIDLYAIYLSGILMWTAFTSVLLAPLTEEIFFRGYMLGEFRKDNTVGIRQAVICIFLVSAAFALGHIFVYQSLSNLFCIFLSGLATGLFYWVTKSVLAPIAIHTAWNILSETKEAPLLMVGRSVIFVVLLIPVLVFILESRIDRSYALNLNATEKT